jgi:hypothetical protein
VAGVPSLSLVRQCWPWHCCTCTLTVIVIPIVLCVGLLIRNVECVTNIHRSRLGTARGVTRLFWLTVTAQFAFCPSTVRRSGTRRQPWGGLTTVSRAQVQLTTVCLHSYWSVLFMNPVIFKHCISSVICEWLWSIGGMILTGETEVLGEKHNTALVVDGWMSMEHWWNGTDRGNWSTGRKTCQSATLPTTNSTWTGLGSKPGLRSERRATNRLTH